MMQVTDTPTTSRVETPNRIPVILSIKKSSSPLATGELVKGITLPFATGELVIEIALLPDDEVVVDELCARLWMFIVDICVVVGTCSPSV